MESVAPPGGVMLSASTVRLVDDAAVLGEPELVQIKGADEPVLARRLLSMREQHRAVERAESTLVGRRWEMSAVEGPLQRAVDGHGAVVALAGSPGIGESRVASIRSPRTNMWFSTGIRIDPLMCAESFAKSMSTGRGSIGVSEYCYAR
jgi:hypothetical protein